LHSGGGNNDDDDDDDDDDDKNDGYSGITLNSLDEDNHFVFRDESHWSWTE